MVLKTTTCRFSGLRIYPGRGIVYVRTDGQQFLFINQKAKGLFNQRKRPAKIAWTTTYRKQHKKVRCARLLGCCCASHITVLAKQCGACGTGSVGSCGAAGVRTQHTGMSSVAEF